MKPLNTMKWLIRREFWENKGMIFWAQLRLGLILNALLALMLIYTRGHSVDIDKMSAAHNTEQNALVGKTLANAYMSSSAPLFMMLAILVFFYCLGAMYEERRDRSILFWKSLPVSDQMTVLSKVALALVVAPLITIVVSIISSFLMLIMICVSLSFEGINLFGIVFLHSDVYLGALSILGMWPVYVLWAIPTVGWLLMVSAWARSKVFLWAVGLPVLSLVVAKMTQAMFHLNVDLGWFAHNIVMRMLGGLFPGVWLAFDDAAKDAIVLQQLHGVSGEAIVTQYMGNMFTQSWMSLGNAHVWLGVVAGAAMIFAAARLRRWRDES